MSGLAPSPSPLFSFWATPSCSLQPIPTKLQPMFKARLRHHRPHQLSCILPARRAPAQVCAPQCSLSSLTALAHTLPHTARYLDPRPAAHIGQKADAPGKGLFLALFHPPRTSQCLVYGRFSMCNFLLNNKNRLNNISAMPPSSK